jgi:hypothetical protein
MEAIFDGSLTTGMTALLLGALLVALAFEFVNGFHDTANAVATVIYTNTLKSTAAVVVSGVCNFAGVFVGGIAVAMAIIRLRIVAYGRRTRACAPASDRVRPDDVDHDSSLTGNIRAVPRRCRRRR